MYGIEDELFLSGRKLDSKQMYTNPKLQKIKKTLKLTLIEIDLIKEGDLSFNAGFYTAAAGCYCACLDKIVTRMLKSTGEATVGTEKNKINRLKSVRVIDEPTKRKIIAINYLGMIRCMLIRDTINTTRET